MKRCFLIVGPESAGNRFIAAHLIRAGCQGDASTNQRWDQTLPERATPAAVIRSFPHGNDWPDLETIYFNLCACDYETTTIVVTRHPAALVASQVARGHAADAHEARAMIEEALRSIFRQIRPPFHVISYEALAYGPPAAAREFLEAIGLPPITAGPLVINGELAEVQDGNAKYFTN